MNDSAESGPGPFDHYARLVRRLLHVPVGLVSIVEVDRQWFPGMTGLPEPWRTTRETPLSHSFCQHVVRDQQPLVVRDARLDPRLAGNRAIEDLDVIAYAGWPLSDHTGRTIGSLCAIDSVPRDWSDEDVTTLQDLAVACSAELGERARAEATAAALAAAEELGERSRALLALSTSLSATQTLADVAAAVVEVSRHELGCVRGGVWLRESSAVTRTGGAGASSDGPEMMGFVQDTASIWLSAETFSDLPMNATNPLGAALVEEQAQFYSTREEQNLRYPHLANPHQLGEARAFVPLVLGNRAYGTLALMWPTRRTFSGQDRLTIAALAAYTAQAVHRAQLLRDSLEVSLTLQRAMLTSLPRPEHLDLAARYRPASAREQVGGDWYDAVVMPGGETLLMIGDVTGHDIEAAALMGQLRSMLRMVAWGSAGRPSHGLQQLDLAMRDLAVDTIASVVLARIEQPDVDATLGCRLHWANAGHPPPLLVTPGGTVRFLRGEQDDGLLLGVVPESGRRDEVVWVPPGSVLLLYTDGLVERRGESIDEGLARLRAVAARAGDLGADDFVDQVLAELVGSDTEDDIALLAVRFRQD